MLFLALKKVLMVKINPCQIPTPDEKKNSKISNSPFWSGIPLPLTLFGKPWYFTIFTYFRRELVLVFNLIFCVEIIILILILNFQRHLTTSFLSL